MPLVRQSKRLLKQTLTSAAQRRNTKLTPLDPTLWDLELHPGGRLSLEGLDLAELVDRWGSPLHVVHAAALRRNIAAFQSADPGHAPCEVYYSYKTNPIPAVLRLMHDLGVGAEIISEYELWLAFRLGVEPSRIVYNGPVKSDASLVEAITREIGLINANHREEIARIGAIAARLGKRPRTGVRVSTSASWSGQFGAPIGTGEALEAVGEAYRHPSLDVCALHVHFGAPLRSEGQLAQLLAETLDFAEAAERAFGLELEVLDFGGSLATPTVTPLNATEKRLNMTLLADLAPPDPESMIGIGQYVRTIRRAVDERYARKGRQPPRIFLEPGRAMTGNTQLLLTTVQAIKSAFNAAPYAILDAGINLAQSVQSEYHQVFAVTKMNAASKRSYRLAGPICSPGDVLVWACSLPELTPGDKLMIADAGAYFVPFATSFSFPQPAIVLVSDGKERLIRRAERFEDLVVLDELESSP
jgi:diaminopimelate decarboxylase